MTEKEKYVFEGPHAAGLASYCLSTSAMPTSSARISMKLSAPDLDGETPTTMKYHGPNPGATVQEVLDDMGKLKSADKIVVEPPTPSNQKAEPDGGTRIAKVPSAPEDSRKLGSVQGGTNQAKLLAAVGQHDGYVSANRLREEPGINSNSVGGALKTLWDRLLVERRKREEFKSEFEYQITTHGKGELERLGKA